MLAARRHIFISYARSDGRELAELLRYDLNARGFSLWQDVIAMAAGEKWWQQIKESIERSAAVIFILTEGALSSGVVRDELSCAWRAGIPVIPLVHNAKLLAKAPPWILDLDIINLDSKEPDYKLSRERFLSQLRSPPPRRPRPFLVPNLPQTFAPRSDIVKRALTRLIGPDEQAPIPGVTVFAGGGGFGKTTVAIAICRDDRVRMVCDDGILWIQFRPKMSLTDALILLNDQIAMLDPDGKVFTDITQASARFHDLLSGRKILVVLDDVWSDAYLRYFIHPGVTYLVTTRLDTVISRADACRITVEHLQSEQGTDLLHKWIDRRLSAEERSLLDDLARSLGEWALLLELVGAELRVLVSDDRSVAEAVEFVKRRLSRRGYTYLDREDEGDRNAALAESLNASLRVLPEAQRQRFYELGVFPNDVVVPFATIRQLWGATAGYNDLDTEDALESMRRLALFTQFDARAGHLRIHNVIQRVIASRLSSAPDVHRRLIDAWGDVYALPDRYAWTFFGHHMYGSNAADEMRRLLFDFRWLHAKLNATDVVSLIADYAEHSADSDCELLEAVLMMSANAIAEPAQLAVQLVGRLRRLDAPSTNITNLLGGAAVWDDQPALLPVQVDLPSVDVGVHKTLLTASPILSSSVDDDGTLLIVGLANGWVEVWNLQTGSRVDAFESGVGPVHSMAVQGDLVAVGGYYDHWRGGANAPLEVWNWRGRKRLGSIGEDIEGIVEGYAVALRCGIAAITTGATNNIVHIFDWPALKPVTLINGDPTSSGDGNRPGIMRFVDGYFLYQNSGFSCLQITSTLDWTFRGTVAGEIEFEAAPCAADGKLLVKSLWRCSDTRSHFFCQIDPKEDDAPLVEVRRYHPRAFAMVQDGDALLVCSDVVEYRDLMTGEISRTLEGHSAPISSVHVIRERVITTSLDHSIRIWSRGIQRHDVSEAKERFYRPPILCLQRQGEKVFLGTKSGHVQEWTWKLPGISADLSTDAAIRALAVNDEWLVYSCFDTLKYASLVVLPRDIRQSNSRTGQTKETEHFRMEHGVYDFGHSGVTHLKLLGNLCAGVVSRYYTPLNSFSTGNYTGNCICVLDLARQEVILRTGEWISAAALTDEMVAGGTSNGYIELWQIGTGERILRHAAHNDAVTEIVFHKDFLITCSRDQTIRIWFVGNDLVPVQTIPDTGTVNSLQANGGLLFCTSDDHIARIIDWEHRRTLAKFTDDAALLACDWEAGLGTLIVGGMSGRLHILQANRCLLDALQTLAKSDPFRSSEKDWGHYEADPA